MSYANEAELVRACKTGDREAFSELVAIYQNKIINIAYGMLSDQEDAYDAAQEVFVKIYRSITGFQEKSSLSTWIYRITKNVCMDFLRKRTRSAPTISMNASRDDEESDFDIKDTSPTPHEYFEMNETQLEVRRAIGELSDEFRTVITLYDLEGMSYDEISKIIDCPVGTVKSRLNRARKALLKNLSKKKELFF